MRWVRRIEFATLTGIDVDRFHAEAVHLALVEEKLHRLGRGTGGVRAIGATVGIGAAWVQLRPISAAQDPAARRDSSMLALPGFDVRNREHEIFILGRFARAVDDAGTGDEIARRD